MGREKDKKEGRRRRGNRDKRKKEDLGKERDGEKEK